MTDRLWALLTLLERDLYSFLEKSAIQRLDEIVVTLSLSGQQALVLRRLYLLAQAGSRAEFDSFRVLLQASVVEPRSICQTRN